MSHRALNRVAIRLLHDAALVDALYADPVRALAGAGVTPEERAWLVAVPRVAWRTDPERPLRVLGALRDEFPASFVLAPTRAGGFFGSAHFHAAVQERGSLALAFGAHMGEDANIHVAAVARLETATATVRRAPTHVPPSPSGRLRLTPAARVVRIPGNGAALLAAVRDGRTWPRLDPIDDVVLVFRVPVTAEVTIEGLPDGLAHLLARAETEAPRERLSEVLVALGADASAAEAVLDGLVADSILV
jgi:hypothetical protein